MTLIQWVNLDGDDFDEYKKVDSEITSKDRCGKISIKTAFDKDKVPLEYKVKVTAIGTDNAVYTAAEQIRNPNFKMSKGTADLATETDVLMTDEIQLPAAGGDKYKLTAKDANDKEVESVEIETWRKLFYQVLTMDDAKGTVPSYSLVPMETHAKQHFISLKKVGADGKIPYFKTLTNDNGERFADKVKAAYTMDDKLKDVGFVVVFSDYIADVETSKLVLSYQIGTPNSRINMTSTDVTVSNDNFLWFGLDDIDDALKTWFISGKVIYELVDPTTLTTISETYVIQQSNVEITGSKYFTYGGYYQIKILRDAGLDALLGKAAGTITYDLDLHVAGGWTNGYSWRPWGDRVRLITCSRRPVWEDMPTNTQEYTWNHEVGHRFGMVAFGDKTSTAGHAKLPDGPSTLYGENRGVNDKEHAGPHCENGATFNASTKVWSGVPGCVMFGANGIDASHAPKEYCSECTKIVRKLDLSK